LCKAPVDNFIFGEAPVSFLIGLVLFIGVAGRLDARLPWKRS
jgi:hypothetical protein